MAGGARPAARADDRTDLAGLLLASYILRRMKKTDRQLGMGRDITRRDFIHDAGLAGLGLALAGTGALALSRSRDGKEYVWQIDPFKCTQCGRTGYT